MTDSSKTISENSVKRSPIAILVGGFVGFLILIVAFIGIVSMFEEKPAPEDVLEPMLASQPLPDGSKLILKAATLGTTHELNQPYPRRENSMFTAAPEVARMNTSLTDERLGLWFEQFAMPSLEPDDFAWWTRTTVLDEAGKEINDFESARFIEYQFGSSSEMGSRPYPPADLPNRPQIIAAVSFFPMFRNSNDTLTVRIYGTDPKPVAEFEIPNPMKAKSFPVWTPQPLPISQTISGITMTLEDVQYTRRKWTNSSGAVSYTFKLIPNHTVSQNGTPITEGTIGAYRLSDALGHQGGHINPGLPLDEAAWKLTVPWRRKPQSITDPGQFVVSGELTPLAPEETPERLTQTLRRRTSKISLLAIGAGEQKMKNLIPRSGGNWSMSTSARFADEYHGIEFDSDDRGSELSIRSHVSWLVLQIESSPSEIVDLLLLDEHDEVIESKAVDAHELTVLLFEAPEGPVRLKAVVQEELPFEFTFAPPEVVDE